MIEKTMVDGDLIVRTDGIRDEKKFDKYLAGKMGADGLIQFDDVAGTWELASWGDFDCKIKGETKWRFEQMCWWK